MGKRVATAGPPQQRRIRSGICQERHQPSVGRYDQPIRPLVTAALIFTSSSHESVEAGGRYWSTPTTRAASGMMQHQRAEVINDERSCTSPATAEVLEWGAL